jgi:acetyl-CoA carboxylase biotin carboxyl carrier protein
MVRSLAAVMHQSNVTELDLALGALSLRLRRPEYGPSGESALAPPNSGPLPPLPDGRDHEHVITAPMIGTFYSAPTPGSPPFIAEGDEVVAGQTIGIIEAMKIMNEIVADRSGVITAILAANGEPVEYGSPLVRLAARRGDRP